jgi:hypothetical protein
MTHLACPRSLKTTTNHLYFYNSLRPPKNIAERIQIASISNFLLGAGPSFLLRIRHIPGEALHQRIRSRFGTNVVRRCFAAAAASVLCRAELRPRDYRINTPTGAGPGGHDCRRGSTDALREPAANLQQASPSGSPKRITGVVDAWQFARGDLPRQRYCAILRNYCLILRNTIAPRGPRRDRRDWAIRDAVTTSCPSTTWLRPPRE